MSTVFTMPGKAGDAILQYPIAFHWAKETGKRFECWMDEATCKPLVPLFEAQPCVEKVVLMGGVEHYNCGGQPFHMNLPTSAFTGNTIYHLGFRSFPVRQITLQTLNDVRLPVEIKPGDLSSEPVFVVPEQPMERRLVIHGQAVCPHTRSTPQLWKFLAGVRGELERLFQSIEFVGSERDLEVARRAYPEWGTFEDGGDFLKLASRIASSACMIGVGSAPITLAGALKVPGIRVHDVLPGNPPRVIWNNLGEAQINETEEGLRSEWPKFRDRWLIPVDSQAATS